MHHVTTPVPLLFNPAYADTKKSDVMHACPWLSSLLTHIHTQINVIYGIITSMTVQMQAHHSVLSNDWGVYNSLYTIETDKWVLLKIQPTTHTSRDKSHLKLDTLSFLQIWATVPNLAGNSIFLWIDATATMQIQSDDWDSPIVQSWRCQGHAGRKWM